MTPALRPVYEWFSAPDVREIVVVKAAQIGFTDLIVDLIMWIAMNDPAPTALYYADSLTARRMMLRRIIPALQALGAVRSRAANRHQDATSYECRLGNGFQLIVSWASSIAATASMEYKYIFCDEVDKPGYQVIGQEGSTLGRIRERKETYFDSKLVIGSTPTVEAGIISQELGRCDAIYDYVVPCPRCGSEQPLGFFPPADAAMRGCVVWDGGREATIEQVRQARYACRDCDAHWTSAEKDALVQRGRAALQSGSAGPRIGYRLSRLVSRFPGGRLDALVSDWLAKRSDPIEAQGFWNSALGLPWKEVVEVSGMRSPEKAVLASLRAGEVPPDAAAVILTVDVQQDHFWWRLRAWARDGTSWGMGYGVAASFEDVEQIAFHRGYRQGDHYLPVWRIGIDSGGTRAAGAYVSRTEEVYSWFLCNRHRASGSGRIFVCKGSARALGTDLVLGKPLERLPSNKPLPIGHGLQVVEVNTSAMKERFWHAIELAQAGEPRGAYIESEACALYFRQITAEEKRVTRIGAVEWVQTRAENHLLDCEVLQMAMASSALLGGVAALPGPLPADPVMEAARPPPAPTPTENPWTRGLIGGGLR